MPHSRFPRRALVVLLAVALAAPATADTAGDLKTLHGRRMEQIAKSPAPGEVEKILAAAKPDGSFADLDYASTLVNDGWEPRVHLDRMSTLVGAYLADGPDKGSPEVKATVLKGLDWWLAHDYQSKNWFWNQIGVPGRLAPTLLAFWDDLTAGQKAASLRILSRAQVGNTGTNLVWLCQVVIDRGLLTGDTAAVRQAYAAIAADIRVAPEQQNGPQPDSSFLYHGPLLYTFGYGIAYLHEQAAIAAMVAGTGFAVPEPKLALLRDWTLDGAQWLSRGPAVDMAGLGRNVARKGANAKALIDIGRDLLKVNAGRDGELRDMLARTEGLPDAKPLVGNRQFWRADLMAHHRPGWYASARLYSARTKNTEWGNGEALRSFYIADGTNLLMRDGQEYTDLYPVWDWQHVPGTTVELLPGFGPVAGRPDGDPAGFNPGRDRITRPTAETFVGGVSDGQYGASGGRFTRDALSVRRGWFFFDDQYVCLGSGLTCASGNPVVTTLDQRRLRGPVTVADASGTATYGAGTAGPHAPGEHGVTAATWLLHDGVGYAFFAPVLLHFDDRPRTGSWHDISLAYPPTPETHDVFDAWLEHGPSPHDAAFAYAVYPNTDAAALAAAAKTPPVTVARNTPDCQAVWHAGLHRGGAIFFAPGSVELRPGLTLAVDRPCMALLTTADGLTRVTVSDPENALAMVHVTVTTDGKTATADVTLPDGGRAGASVTADLSP